MVKPGIQQGLGEGVIISYLEEGGNYGILGFVCQLNSVRVGGMDSLAVHKIHRQLLDLGLALV